MAKLRMGIMGCADIALRAMAPAMVECTQVQLVAAASRTADKAQVFAARFNCDAITGYKALLRRDDIDAVYMPLPTGLHEEWVVNTLEAGKHILVEKSFAMNYESAQRMVELARAKKLLIVENFLFPHHSQYTWIKNLTANGKLGDINLLRSTFGFPSLPGDNFRYNRELGGGALFDAGAYVVKVSQLFLGNGLTLLGSYLKYDNDLGVDVFGGAMFRNSLNQAAQVSFGFNSYYQCTLELLGTKGKLMVDRIFTPPPGFKPSVQLEHQDIKQVVTLPSDNHYVNMCYFFANATKRPEDFQAHRDDLLRQTKLLDMIRKESTG